MNVDYFTTPENHELSDYEIHDLAKAFTLEELTDDRCAGEPDWTIQQFVDRYLKNRMEIEISYQK